VRGWRRMRLAELQRAYRRAALALRRNAPSRASMLRLAIPPRFLLWIKRWNPCAHRLTWSRQALTRFWRKTGILIRRGRFDALDVSGLAFNAVQELTLFATFAWLFFSRLLHRLLSRVGVPTRSL